MAEYIEKSDALRKSFRYVLSDGIVTPPVVFASAIEQIPAADVQRTVIGTAVLKDDGRAHCEKCDFPVNSHTWNFCPKCGAKMVKWTKRGQRNDAV